MLVFDASTLILLTKIDILQIVLQWFSAIIPELIKEEVTYKNTMDARIIAKQIKEKKIVVIKNPSTEKINRVLKDFPLSRGEAAAILTAKEKNGILTTDDGVIIKVCKIFDVKFVTAVHFLIEARIKEILNESLAVAKLELLIKYARYTPQIVKDAEERIRGG